MLIRKEAYIDPEFAANPFKLLDDDQPSETDEDSKSKQRKPSQENVFKPSDLGKKSTATSQLNSNSIMDQLV